MSVKGFNHYNLRASRELLEMLKAFYCEVVGLEEGPRPVLGSFGYWLYANSQCLLHLSEARPGEERLTHVTTTFDHVAFTCTGLEEMEQRLRQGNIEFRKCEMPSLGIIQLFLQDPAGNGIELSFSNS